MYSCMNVNEGAPARLYRAPSEIRRDMIGISRTIRENEEMLSVHNLLIEMIPEWAEKSPEDWIPELEEIVAEANDAMDDLIKTYRIAVISCVSSPKKGTPRRSSQNANIAQITELIYTSFTTSQLHLGSRSI